MIGRKLLRSSCLHVKSRVHRDAQIRRLLIVSRRRNRNQDVIRTLKFTRQTLSTIATSRSSITRSLRLITVHHSIILSRVMIVRTLDRLILSTSCKMDRRRQSIIRSLLRRLLNIVISLPLFFLRQLRRDLSTYRTNPFLKPRTRQAFRTLLIISTRNYRQKLLLSCLMIPSYRRKFILVVRRFPLRGSRRLVRRVYRKE